MIARIDCLLGGDSVDPTGMCIKLPSCHTDTFQACRTRLQDAGFTATITQHTLSADDAIMEDQADRVTATSPAAATQTEHDTDKSVIRTSWYYNYPETDGGAASCRGTGTTSASTACDEWPWRAPSKGGHQGCRFRI